MEGSGGGVVVPPLGYIELRDGGTRFRPIMDLAKLIPVVAAGGLLSVLVMRGLSKLLRP